MKKVIQNSAVLNLTGSIVRFGSDGGHVVSWAGRPLSNRWNHYAVVANRTTNLAELFINGVSQGTGNISTFTGTEGFGPTSGNNQISRIGRNYSVYSIGSIDQVKIFNYARTAAQVAWDYNRGGPVGHWKMNECSGTAIHDSSGNGNTGTLTNANPGTCDDGTGTSFWNQGASGKYGASGKFDGTDDKASITDVSTLNLTRGSISAWVKPVQYNLGGDIVSRSSSGAISTVYWSLFTYNGKAYGVVANGTAYKQLAGSKNFSAGTWSHVVLTFDNGTIRLYHDGALDALDTYSITPGSSTASTITIAGNNGGQASYYRGQIDDVRIFNYALNATQVRTLFNENSAVRFGP
ncbi:hypothetical protein HY310_01215 [Candidatus Microgenomates bacterium]|nr:hypothetical protein [Candidatus Microgenomates bacterium]